MTCKDCIHNEMCYGTHTDDSPTCCDFKDKSRSIELPCKVGDTIYTFSYGKVIEAEVLKIEYSCEAENYSKFIREKITLFGKDIGEIRIDFCDLGNMFFLTREEAEKALKERERE